MARTSLKNKGRALLKASKEVNAPEFNLIDYKLSLLKNLNYYSLNVDPKKKRAWAMAYWKSKGHDTSLLENMKDSWFETIGAVAHMVFNRKIPLVENEVSRLDNAFDQLLDIAKANNLLPEKKQVKHDEVTVQDRIKDVTSEHIGELEGTLDDFIINGTEFDIKNYIKVHELSAPVIRGIANTFKMKLPEYELAVSSKDDDIKEAHGFRGKRKNSKILEFVKAIVDGCSTSLIVARTTRKPRKRKEKPASVLVAKVKYSKENVEYNLKSIDVTKIIGADVVWVFNSKYRKLYKYEAQEGMQIGVKGTTLQNFNPEKSGCKTLRNPKVQLNDVMSFGKRSFNNLFLSVKGTVGKATGRINDECLILGAFT